MKKKKGSFLVVDDEQTFLDSARVIQIADFELTPITISDPGEAPGIIESQTPMAVVCDQFLQNEFGINTLELAREMDSELYLFLTTGKSMSKDVIQRCASIKCKYRKKGDFWDYFEGQLYDAYKYAPDSFSTRISWSVNMNKLKRELDKAFGVIKLFTEDIISELSELSMDDESRLFLSGREYTPKEVIKLVQDDTDIGRVFLRKWARHKYTLREILNER